MKFKLFKRKKYNFLSLPDISRINLDLFFREFESKFVNKMAAADLKNTDFGQHYRVSAVLYEAKRLAMESAKEAIELAYRPK